jgi:hypothetical protein
VLDGVLGKGREGKRREIDFWLSFLLGFLSVGIIDNKLIRAFRAYGVIILEPNLFNIFI